MSETQDRPCDERNVPDLAPLDPGYVLSSIVERQGTKMSDKAKRLIEQARALSPQDRIALVEDLLDSLDHADPDVDRLWAREASDRLAAYRRGELAAKDLSEVVAKYRP
jgi:putative addiction module component (TIGR02574 family)